MSPPDAEALLARSAVPSGSGVPPDAEALLARCTFPLSGEALCCAVSGGPDSLALLVLACLAGCSVTAIHVDHGLRPDSAADGEVVEEAARRFGAQFLQRQVTLEPGGNLEARAREARRAVLPQGTATGHTADDQVETILLNLIRGAGLDGLSGMRAGPAHPILGLRRAETVALCAALQLVPVADPSNHDLRYRRNRIRHEMLPMLCALAERDVVPVMARQASLLAEDAELLAALARGVDHRSASALVSAPGPLARRALRGWLADALGHPPGAAAVERVMGVARGEAIATEIGGGVRVARSSGRLNTTRPNPPAPHPPVGSSAGRVAPVSDTAALAASDQDPALGQIVVEPDQLARRVAELGVQITRDYTGRPPLLIGVLKGAFLFMSDLARAIRLPVECDFMAVASYGTSTRTSGVVRIVKDLDLDLSGRHVLVVEDIVDSGLTLSYLRRNLAARGPASLEVCALLVKDGLQRNTLDLRYVGFHIPADFVVGYGLDIDEQYRNLPYICKYVERT